MMLGYDLQGKFTVVALHCAFSRALPRISSFVPVDKIKQKRYVRRRIRVVSDFSEKLPIIYCLSIMCSYNTID